MIEAPITKNSNLNLKNSKTILALGGIALIIMVSAVILFSNDMIIPFYQILPMILQLILKSHYLLILIYLHTLKMILFQLMAYLSNASIVNLSIQNQNNVLVWAEQISVKSNGQYATLAIAGGSGWDISGNYTLKVDNGSEIKSITFLFTS